ncbi:MAG TPA: class I SAM-dependent methyltransferase [Thermoanaerobaculia bacterium]|nr:class I SAM-dependent methyltransferase [Thermoanaerobaculia bacterium]
MKDAETLARHRAVWEARPELREVYREWFGALLEAVEGLAPLVELGSGPGFFKDHSPGLVATDVVEGLRVNVRCDAGALPFGSGRLGALIMVDTLHHLPRPLEFLREAARVLRPGGRLALIEPWITPPSWVLYRFFHHEDCRLGVDLRDPFGGGGKRALDGNAAIPYLALGRLAREGDPLRVLRLEPFVGLPYLATFGFKASRPLPAAFQAAARVGEKALHPLRRWLATRVFGVLEKAAA